MDILVEGKDSTSHATYHPLQEPEKSIQNSSDVRIKGWDQWVMSPQFILTISKFVSHNQLIQTIDPNFPENERLEPTNHPSRDIHDMGIIQSYPVRSGMIS